MNNPVRLILVMVAATILYIVVLAGIRRRNNDPESATTKISSKLPTVFYIMAMVLFSILIIRDVIK